jgi:hypothetical protein
MTPAIVERHYLPAMSEAAIGKARHLETTLLQMPQVEIQTRHHFHAGMYARTIRIPAGVVITGALIKIATLLILNGKASVFIGDEVLEFDGYHLIPANAGRKQAFLAHEDTDLTMLFPTLATTVDEAEAEFTDEAHRLLSRQTAQDQPTITGERKCLE